MTLPEKTQVYTDDPFRGDDGNIFMLFSLILLNESWRREELELDIRKSNKNPCEYWLEECGDQDDVARDIRWQTS